MLIRELIPRHLSPKGVLYLRGIRLDETQVPPGVRAHYDGDEGVDTVALVAGDLVIVSVPVGLGLPEYIDTDLPVGVTLVLLLEVEVIELPVDRLLATLGVSKLQVVEATVLSGTRTATVAVVATRTDDLVAPMRRLAHDLEPGYQDGSVGLRRLLGEHALDGLVQPARQRALGAQVGELKARLVEVDTELGKLRAEGQEREAGLARDLDEARREADAASRRMKSMRSSRAFRVASGLTRASGVVRRIIHRPGSGPSA